MFDPHPRGDSLSPARARLASFENAYAVAVQLRQTTGISQFVLRTGDPLQPFRTVSQRPARPTELITHVA